MGNSTFILLAFVLCGSFALGQTESDIRDRMMGTWKLVSSEQIMKDGSTRPDPSFGARQGFPHVPARRLYVRLLGESRPAEMG